MNINKVIKITTPKQFEKLVEILEKNPQLARGFHNNVGKVNIKEEWNKIAVKMNGHGPPSRQGEGWMKVWADFKFKLRKKILHNKTEIRATGGGSNKLCILTPTEETASNLLQLDTIIRPEGEEIGIECTITREPEPQPDDVNMVENVDKDGPCTSQSAKKRPNKKGTEKKVLLEEQLKVQTELYTEVKRSLLEIEKYNRRQFKIKEEKLKLYKKELKKKEEHRNLLIKLRQEEIEIKRRIRRT